MMTPCTSCASRRGGSRNHTRRPKIADPDSPSEIATLRHAAARGALTMPHAPRSPPDGTSRSPAPQPGTEGPGSFRGRLPGAVFAEPANNRPLPVAILFPFQPVVDG